MPSVFSSLLCLLEEKRKKVGCAVSGGANALTLMRLMRELVVVIGDGVEKSTYQSCVLCSAASM
jgi:hypothetical protein